MYYFPEMNNGVKISIKEITEVFVEQLPDYHVFCFPSWRSSDEMEGAIEFKVFHEKDFTEIQYEELKKIIEDSLKESTT